MHRTLRLLALTLIAIVGPLAGESGSHPELWQWMHELQPEAVRAVVRTDQDGEPTVLLLRTGNGRRVLDLVPLDLTASRETGPAREHGRGETPRLLRGAVRGEPGSRAAVSMTSGGISAMIRSGTELLLVDVPAAGGPGELYRSHDPFAGPSRLIAGLSANASSVFVLDVAAVADFEFFTKFGDGTTAQMLAVLNLVDAIYLEQVDVTFDVTFTHVYDEEADPFSNFNSPNLFNNYRDATGEFGALRDASGGAFEAAGLAHLFSDRNLNVAPGGKINAGFGFIDVLCDADRGVSLSTAPTVGTSLHAVILAHELGHNFGAPHDSEGACAATPAGQFLMSPNATGNAFSDCSKGIMTANRDEASCIDEQASVLCGDATGDGKLLASDALFVLRTGVGQLQCDLCVCDADDSGSISASDALRVLRASVDQPVELLCPLC